MARLHGKMKALHARALGVCAHYSIMSHLLRNVDTHTHYDRPPLPPASTSKGVGTILKINMQRKM